MSIRNVVNYPDEFFKNLMEYQLENLALNALYIRDYNLFEKAIKTDLGLNITYIADMARDYFNDTLGLYIIDQNLRDIIDYQGHLQIKAELEKEHITFADQELQDYYYNISTIDNKVKKNTCVELDAFDEIYKIETENNIENFYNIQDVLLSRSYSKYKNKEDLMQIYSNLLNSSKVASDILHISAINIMNNNTFKISFSNLTHPCANIYFNGLNYISVGNLFGKNANEDSVIHELGHYALSSLQSGHHSMPIFITLDKFFYEMYETTYVDIYSANRPNLNQLINSPQGMHSLIKYLNATKKIVEKAADLLKVDFAEICSNYIFSEQIVNCFTDNSPISIIYNYQISKIKDYGTINNQLFYKNYWEYYLKENANNDNINYSNYTEIFRYMNDEYAPSLIRSLNLTQSEQIFLFRIADWMFLPLQNTYNANQYFHELILYEELIVRYPELKAAKIDQDLLDSFSDLVQYWEEEITPIVSNIRINFEKNSPYHLDFSYPGGECLERYGCFKEKPVSLSGEEVFSEV